METRLIPIVLLAAVGIVRMADASSAISNRQTLASPCRTPDVLTTSHLHYLRMSASSSTPENVNWRGSAIPLITDTTTSITVVTDSATCARAIVSFDTLAGLGDSGVTEVEVLRADTVFVISHPRIRPGEWVGRFVVDSSMRFISSYLH
jgi:hypothetical protein